MIYANTADIVAQLADDMDVSAGVAASVLDVLLCDDDGE
jgi:hypothetical protein